MQAWLIAIIRSNDLKWIKRIQKIKLENELRYLKYITW